MKVYFSVWAYCDYSRVGYDTVGVTYYHTIKPEPSCFGYSEVYEVEIPDKYTEEEVIQIGNKATRIMEETEYYDPPTPSDKFLLVKCDSIPEKRAKRKTLRSFCTTSTKEKQADRFHGLPHFFQCTIQSPCLSRVFPKNLKKARIHIPFLTFENIFSLACRKWEKGLFFYSGV